METDTKELWACCIALLSVSVGSMGMIVYFIITLSLMRGLILAVLWSFFVIAPLLAIFQIIRNRGKEGDPLGDAICWALDLYSPVMCWYICLSHLMLLVILGGWAVVA
jgi:hypothetical protein